MKRKSLTLISSLIILVALLAFSYESLRYKGNLSISHEVKVDVDGRIELTFTLYNHDWRIPLSSFSVHIQNDQNNIDAIEMKTPSNISFQKVIYGDHSTIFAEFPEGFELNPKEKKTITITVKSASDKPQKLAGYFRKVGATGDGLVMGQHSNTRFTINLSNKTDTK